MPLYEYRCEKCGELFEVRQKFSDEPLRTHEECGGKVDRLLSAPALQFKGSGWYVNDYAKSGSQNSDSKNGSGKTEAGKTETGKTETKSEKKESTGSTSSSSSEKSSTPASSDKK